MSTLLASIPRYWKAVIGFLTPGVVALGVAVTDGSDGGTQVTRTEWIGIVTAMVLTGGLVAGKANKPSGDVGASATELCMLVIAAGVVVLALVALFGRP